MRILGDMGTVTLPCAKCGVDVPEGSRACPQCGAGLGSVVLSKYRLHLSRTLIAKAVELRNSIPWASASQVILLEDPKRPGVKKLRTAARNVGLALIAAVGLYAWRYVGRDPVLVLEVTAA